jgi:hypothetical protein
METKKPLSHRAMMVTLTQRSWKATATDQDVAAQTELAQQAEHGTITVLKKLCPDHILAGIRTALSLGRSEHYKMTVPGLYKGQALLSTAMFETYAMAQDEIKGAFFTRVDEFVKIYPDIVDRAARRFGSAYKPSDYPSPEGVREYFDYRVQFAPVPETSDWRLEGVTSADLTKLRHEVEDSVGKMYSDATQVLFNRTRKLLESIVAQTKNYNSRHPGNTLGDATIDNLKEISSMVTAMNITGDPVLEQVGNSMIKSFIDVEAKELRRSDERRKEIGSTAKNLLAKLNKSKLAA